MKTVDGYLEVFSTCREIRLSDYSSHSWRAEHKPRRPQVKCQLATRCSEDTHVCSAPFRFGASSKKEQPTSEYLMGLMKRLEDALTCEGDPLQQPSQRRWRNPGRRTSVSTSLENRLSRRYPDNNLTRRTFESSM